MKLPITVQFAETQQDLEQILTLQKSNHVSGLSSAQKVANGFVTVQHDLELLTKMNEAAPQIIAKSKDEVVAYALVMPKAFSALIPTLVPMFDSFKQLSYKGKSLEAYTYYVMGQICIDENYRGQGLFEKLYAKHKETHSSTFDLCLTEVSTSNQRSMKAHERVGFKILHTFQDETDEWNILVWDWR